MAHVPVLLKEVLEYLNVEHGELFVDGTVGDGGHAKAILEKNKQAKVLGIDLDQTTLDKLQKQLIASGLSQRITLVSGNYRNIDQIFKKFGWEKVDGIVIDLGFSSAQLDDSNRGLSFQASGPLDMRFNLSAELTAEKIVNSYTEAELARILREYGEEKFFRPIARAIIKERKTARIKTTTELAEVIRSAIPKPVRFKANDNIRRVFQGIRIEVNQELENLKKFLPKSIELLKPKGRLVVISFHSLEDRIVKEFLSLEAKDCVCPPEFPTCVCGKSSKVRILTRKPITAQEEEILLNPRSKPAKLRAAEKNT